MKRLSADDILSIHGFLAKEFGEKGDLRDKSALGEIVKRLESDDPPGILEKAAVLMADVVNAAPFTDGNMRTAFFATDVFLRLNGYYIRCDNVLTHRFFSALLDENRITAETLLPWVVSNAEKLG